MRFRVAVLFRGSLEMEEFFPSFRSAKSRVNALRRASPELIASRDIIVEDTVTGTEWTTDPFWNLVEM